MKHTIIAAFVALLIAGCGTQPIKVVPVDKPLPMCPTPPVVPTVEFQVDKLVPSDISDPGKVGQAYKYDMTVLRTQARIYQQILDEYTKTSQNFDAVRSEINKSFSTLQTNVDVAQKPNTP